jgi:hypothetical protein
MSTVSDYNQDGLKTVHNNDFMSCEKFSEAYQRGVIAAGTDYKWHWRVHIGLWAAEHCSHMDGDFVECGVNAGFLSSAIMQYLDWDQLDKTFYLLDTFSGIDPKYTTKDERESGILEKNQKLIRDGFYVVDIEKIRKNFSEWKNCQIIVGAVPGTLVEIKAKEISFLHIDMNCAPPEVAAAEYLWAALVDGAIVLLDDYAYSGYHHQKYAMDKFAKSKGVTIVSLPTGQGMMIKPPEKNKGWKYLGKLKGILKPNVY